LPGSQGAPESKQLLVDGEAAGGDANLFSGSGNLCLNKITKDVLFGFSLSG
jgi:hypothetical protein